MGALWIFFFKKKTSCIEVEVKLAFEFSAILTVWAFFTFAKIFQVPTKMDA